MDELREWAKDYIQMEEMHRFRNEVRQVGQKHDKWEGSTKADSHVRQEAQVGQAPASPKRAQVRALHIPDNRTIILEEAFNLEVPIKLPPTKPHKLGLDTTKYSRYHRNIDYNI